MPSCCHHEIVPTLIVTDNYSYLMLLLNICITGIAGSFTHCIGMCGPIAANQASMRLMEIPPQEMNQAAKIKAVIALPYFLGKAITYAMMALLLAITKKIAINSLPECFVYAGRMALLSILATALLIFALFEMKKIYDFPHNMKLISRMLNVFRFDMPNIVKKITNTRLRATSYQGLVLGMLLGLLPCGLVYNMLIIISGSNANVWESTFAMFSFGLATMPGLLIFGCIGNLFLLRYKKLFSVFYVFSLLVNSIILFYYATQ